MKKSPFANVMMAALLLLATNGCSLFAPKTETINIDSDPQDAEAIVNIEHLSTPCTVTVPRDQDLIVTVQKDGYKTQVHKINRTLSTYGVLDIVGTFIFIVPVIGLLSPGAFTLEQHSVYAPLVKESD